MLVKESDGKIPDRLPENHGVLMFLWLKKNDEHNPQMTWNDMTLHQMGEAFQLLTAKLLLHDIRNYEICIQAVNETRNRILREN